MFSQQCLEPRKLQCCSVSEGILENARIYICKRNLMKDQKMAPLPYISSESRYLFYTVLQPFMFLRPFSCPHFLPSGDQAHRALLTRLLHFYAVSEILHPQSLYLMQTFKYFLIIAGGEGREFPIKTETKVLASYQPL